MKSRHAVEPVLVEGCDMDGNPQAGKRVSWGAVTCSECNGTSTGDSTCSVCGRDHAAKGNGMPMEALLGIIAEAVRKLAQKLEAEESELMQAVNEVEGEMEETTNSKLEYLKNFTKEKVIKI
uniref:Uncharacterized protein n=1 Tax=Tetraselmis sp. GSL018 TaxID=582737 RepID=A0A061RCK9_9CHLO|eukprot:CAMPEP_0177593526 /NCGR_PEP_ID=MMETSP0419_2-20121207/9203_1 /TAXON_ID=582737 /ORGANISM="Tetraselmis sp., Strain GSL018" /LENGTH=121 /DNA_ID=CAMNT_0019084591 /DNA_START=1 /DNA_END=366 /DNA_ORIENTATION=+